MTEIMQRTGLRFYRVESDVGMMGGLGAHEYMAPCPAGEDEVALGDGYAANMEVVEKSPDYRKDGDTHMLGEQQLTVEPAIEIGNIFKLGTRYSEPLGATYLDEHGNELPIWMGSYGIGPRASWRPRSSSSPTSTASPGPKRLRRLRCIWWRWVVPGRPSATRLRGCTRRCSRGGVDVLYDDREAGPGEKFADAELLGCPVRLTVGRRSLESGEIEVQLRRGRARRSRPAAGGEPAELLRALDELCQSTP